MLSKTMSKQLHRVPTSRVVAIALVLFAATVVVTIVLAIDRSASDIRAQPSASIAAVHPRANPRFSEINELHSVSERAIVETDLERRAIIDRLEAEMLTNPSAASFQPSDATINPFDRMKFLEMNALPSDAALIPPMMEMDSDRQ
jgi:hypothetical protein